MSGQTLTLVILFVVTFVSLVLLCALDPAGLGEAHRQQQR